MFDYNVEFASGIGLWCMLAAIAILVIVAVIRGQRSTPFMYMAPEFTSSCKGIAALGILFSHFLIHSDGPDRLLQLFVLLGAYGVTVFLFISGYIETMLMDKRGESYYNNFFVKKVVRIYIPWVISLIVLVALFHISDVVKILKGVFLFNTIYRENTYNWFVIYILYMYFSLFVWKYLRKNFNNSKKSYLIYIFIVSLVWLTICLLTGRKSNWYYNSFSFFLGCTFSAYKNQLEDFIFKKRWILWAMLIVYVIYRGALFVKFNGTLYNMWIMYSSLVICTFLFVFALKHTLYSKVLSFVGDISLEVFFYGTAIFLWIYNVLKVKATAPSLIIVFVVLFVISKLSSILAGKISSLIIKK